MSNTPVQQKHPVRATIRTGFQAAVALAVLLPVLLPAAGISTLTGIGASILAVAVAITRVMQVPGVEDFLQRFLPFLAAAPRPTEPEYDYDNDPFYSRTPAQPVEHDDEADTDFVY